MEDNRRLHQRWASSNNWCPSHHPLRHRAHGPRIPNVTWSNPYSPLPRIHANRCMASSPSRMMPLPPYSLTLAPPSLVETLHPCTLPPRLTPSVRVTGQNSTEVVLPDGLNPPAPHANARHDTLDCDGAHHLGNPRDTTNDAEPLAI